MAAVLHLTGPVLVGPGDVRAQAWVVEGRITFERPVAAATDSIAGWVLPGLVDAHCHIGLGPQGAVDDATTLAQAQTERGAGVLLIRDAGSPADTAWIDERADLPRVIRAGRHIARTRRYLRNFAHEIEPEQLVEFVTAEARHGDGWVKLVGDWIDRERGDLAPSWPDHVLGPAIAAAHAEGARVTAHCFGEESLAPLLEAGIDCVEHACGLGDDTLALAQERGVAIVPTMVNIESFPGIADAAQPRYPTYAAHMRLLHQRRYATIGAAVEAGLPVYVGTDAGGSLPHGLVAREVAQLQDCGMSPLQALDAACWSARQWLGRPGLAEGEAADLVVYESDPREDTAVLAYPRAVVLRGQAY